VSERPYLSIGEVLGLLLEEFPDITISKIRFLESQGLIEPERTASGYRKFYDADVDRLRFILREQRENYLPLKVIRDRLGDTPAEGLPRGIRNVTVTGSSAPSIADTVDAEFDDDSAAPIPAAVSNGSTEATTPPEVVPAAVTRSHPSARHSGASLVADLVEPPATVHTDVPEKLPVAAVAVPAAASHTSAGTAPPDPELAPASAPASTPTRSAPAPRFSSLDDTGTLARVLSTHLTRAELLEQSGVDGATLDELESYGLVTPRVLGQQVVYEPQASVVAEVAAAFVALGIEVRHLKSWRTSAEREAGLFEQRIAPLLRQRNPQAREQSIEILDQLVQLGGRMRAAMVEQALRQYIDPH
jgi:DNA-binding transcriptional MerR regulator